MLKEVLRRAWVFEDSAGDKWEVDREEQWEGMQVGSRADLEWNEGQAKCQIVQVTWAVSSAKHFHAPLICFSPCRYPLSSAYFTDSLSPPETSLVELISLRCPTVRRVSQEGGFWLALGLACLEVQPGKVQEFGEEVESVKKLKRFVKMQGTERLKWFEKQWNNPDFHSAVTSCFQSLFRLFCRSVGLVHTSIGDVLKPGYALDDAVFQTMAEILKVKLVICLLAEQRIFKGNGAHSPSLYLLVSHGHLYHILYPSARDLPEPRLEPRAEGKVLTIRALWELAQKVKQAEKKWQLMELRAEFLEAQQLALLEHELERQEEKERNECVSCQLARADIKLKCHFICSQCLHSIVQQQLSQPPYIPCCPCSAPLSPATLRQALGSESYRQLQSSLPLELKDYQCTKCLRTGNYKEVYELNCGCCLCLHCAAESIRTSRECCPGNPLPVEILQYFRDLRLACSCCHVIKCFLSNFSHTPCHSLCKACAVDILRDPETACPECDRLYTEKERQRLAGSLQGLCRVCHKRKPYAEMMEMKCDCEICEDCMGKQESWKCPKCLQELPPSSQEKWLWQQRRKQFCKSLPL